MGRGRVDAEDIFYGSAAIVGDDRALGLVKEALAEGNWLKVWGLFERHRDLQHEEPLLEEVVRRRAEEQLLESFASDDFSDWDIVLSFLLRQAKHDLGLGLEPEHALDPNYGKILQAGIHSSGKLGDICRRHISAHHLTDLPPELVVTALTKNEASKEALLRPLGRLLCEFLLYRSNTPVCSSVAGLCGGQAEVVHLRSLSSKNMSACGKHDYGYASLPLGAWKDAEEGLLASRCQECAQAAKGQILKDARKESSLDCSEHFPGASEENVLRVARSTGLQSLFGYLGRSRKEDWISNWAECRSKVAKDMVEEAERVFNKEISAQ